MRKIFYKLIPPWWQGGEKQSMGLLLHYRRIWVFSLLSSLLASLSPLIALTIINLNQYKKSFTAEIVYPINRITSNTRRSLEFFLEERCTALNYIAHENTFETLSDQQKLSVIFKNMKDFFGGFIDIGLIDSKGIQRTYVGPYDLKDKDYKNQIWFKEASIRSSYVSDVFMGFRESPHFAIAVKCEKNDGDFFILRVTFNASILAQILHTTNLQPSSDVFIVNRDGVIQTSSLFFGTIFTTLAIPLPPFSAHTEVIEGTSPDRNPLLVGYAYIRDSPFVLMMIEKHEMMMQGWLSLRRNLVLFMAGSMILIVIVTLYGSSFLVNRIWESDIKRMAVMHKAEYTNKMASIGRLAAGVAHEINNPLAIINEKAGLMKDLLVMKGEAIDKEKFISLLEAIRGSVKRGKNITHRLLGFAKHMDIQREPIHLESLFREVLGFLEKECSYRNISITMNVQENLPSIQCDRGRLQQVFLNILNNAFQAIADGGRIDISLQKSSATMVSATIADNGVGIPEENLKSIFEPFFTTKNKDGTGLGLSITYGIVEKLGGQIAVKSREGVGSSFTVLLPIG